MRSTLALAWFLGGCVSSTAEVPAPAYDDFRTQVYPLLLRDCGFARCHGDVDRFWVIWGPGRTRLDEPGVDPELDPEAALQPFDLPTDRELWMSYQRTRAALTHDEAVVDSPLLRRPLEGREHGGEDHWGHNLWAEDDPSWQLVARWAAGEELDP
ncbi:hypothetical protein G6O69_14795 [Pseudenhygromyxa sp. WMMC2535]|uniref:hypothetical protein n=1 Tax=Pseudenhygromyxa sp. WMMC2535 TaxID=2712867 RepID=UPI001554C4D4|nr:hypothetical protein [Pseudenhygromyxa sp. WMMC2535]NVB39109.1 hypothetical protein [Pseudenhygromyxa sp. WMMC2535]